MDLFDFAIITAILACLFLLVTERDAGIASHPYLYSILLLLVTMLFLKFLAKKPRK